MSQDATQALVNKLETFAQRVEGIAERAIANPSAHKRMTGKYLFDVLVELASCYVFDTKSGSIHDVTQPLVLTRVRRWKACRENDVISRTPRSALSQSYFRKCCHRKLFRGGPTVTSLVHGHVNESHRVGCCWEHCRCCRVIEIPYTLRIPRLEPGQELADPLTPTLVHQDRPIEDPVLADTPVSNAAITTDQQGRSGTSGGARFSFSTPEALTVACRSPAR